MKSLCDEILHPRWNLPLAGCGIVGAFYEAPDKGSFREGAVAKGNWGRVRKLTHQHFILQAMFYILFEIACNFVTPSVTDKPCHLPQRWRLEKWIMKDEAHLRWMKHRYGTMLYITPQRHAVSYHATCCISRRQSLHITAEPYHDTPCQIMERCENSFT